MKKLERESVTGPLPAFVCQRSETSPGTGACAQELYGFSNINTGEWTDGLACFPDLTTAIWHVMAYFPECSKPHPKPA